MPNISFLFSRFVVNISQELKLSDLNFFSKLFVLHKIFTLIILLQFDRNFLHIDLMDFYRPLTNPNRTMKLDRFE